MSTVSILIHIDIKLCSPIDIDMSVFALLDSAAMWEEGGHSSEWCVAKYFQIKILQPSAKNSKKSNRKFSSTERPRTILRITPQMSPKIPPLQSLFREAWAFFFLFGSLTHQWYIFFEMFPTKHCSMYIKSLTILVCIVSLTAVLLL